MHGANCSFCFYISFLSERRRTQDFYTSTPAVVWVILLPLQLRTHHTGQAPGPAGASPHLPKLLDKGLDLHVSVSLNPGLYPSEPLMHEQVQRERET